MSPALPWDETTEGATIKLNTPLTDEQLANGLLKIVIQDTGDQSAWLCYADTNSNELLDFGDSSVADITIERNASNKVSKIGIYNLSGSYNIVEISQGSANPYLLASKALPRTGPIIISSSRPITFDEVLAHVKIKMQGSDEWLSANQRDRYACDWKPDPTSPHYILYNVESSEGYRVLSLEASSASAVLTDIKYEP